MPFLNVNTDEVVALTNKLEKHRKKSFPKSVGSTLNALAFKTKQALPGEYKKKGFTERNKKFISFSSRFLKVKGFEVNKMASYSGIADVVKSDAAKNMATQETGGKLNRKYVATNTARTARSNKRAVKAKNRFSKGFKVPRKGTKYNIQKGKKKELIKRMAELEKLGGGIYVYGSGVYRLIKFDPKRGRTKMIKSEYLYSENKTGKVNVKKRNLVRDTGLKIGMKGPQMYKDIALKTLDK